MLQRQTWRPSSLHHDRCLYMRSGLRTRIPHYYGTQNRGHGTTVNIRTAQRQHGITSKGPGSSMPHRSGGLAGQQTIKRNREQTLRTPEPWVNPSSLSDTLDAHRSANRKGIARDGAPVQKTRRDQGRATKLGSKRGPWTGMDLLHLSLGDLVKKHQTAYGGACPPLLSEWRPHDALQRRLRYPWLSRLDFQSASNAAQPAIQRLNDEMKACGEYFSPSATEKVSANKVFDEIKQIILEFVEPGTVADQIGSRAAGIEGPISDLDINVKLSQHTELAFRNLDKHIRQKKYTQTVVPHAYIKKAHVPIVSGTHVSSGLEFQIQSTVASYESLEVTKAFVAEYPKAYILFKVLKQLLSMRGLNTGVLGGVTSYPLLNMVIVSLKLAESHIPHDDMASQLLRFLDFWSEFNFDKHKITYSPPVSSRTTPNHGYHTIDPISAIPRIVPKHPKAVSDAFGMSLEDPADPSNDLGRSTYGIKHVQACFIEAREHLRKAMQEWDDRLATGNIMVNDSVPLLGWCLGGNYTAFEEARLQLRRSGEQVESESDVN